MMNRAANLTPVKAIRAKCIDCTCGNLKEIKECPVETCPLYLYRLGTNPNRGGIGLSSPAFLRKSAVESGKNQPKEVLNDAVKP